jgi:proline dehydrogenase
MSISRSILLWTSQNKWMKQNVPKLFFVQKALKKFMPGENVEDAIAEAIKFRRKGINTVFTKLGENIKNLSDAETVTKHYLEVLLKINEQNVNAEISLKLTQIGFDISVEAAKSNFERILKSTDEKNNFIWIDMEQSIYTEATIDFYKHFRNKFSNVGVCLQAYLKRTKSDVEKLLAFSPGVRLVKGAYMESPEISFAQKSLVDENYFEIVKLLMEFNKEGTARIAFATHDINLISKIKNYSGTNNISRDKFEFQMLYGIKPSEQIRIVKEGFNIKVLISYGSEWYSWYLRRLAERPANVWFVLKNLFVK